MTLGLSLFFTWLSLVILHRLSPKAELGKKALLAASVFLLTVSPFVFGPTWWLRGLTGDLSILSLCLLGSAVFYQLKGKAFISKYDKKYTEWGVVIVGLLFYPFALGLSLFDPYVLGYDGLYLFPVLLLLSLIAALSRYFGVAVVLLMIVLAWNLQLLESVNLWDYLLDPFVFFYFLVRRCLCRI